MNKLTVMYDASNAFCVKSRWWLAGEPAYLEFDFTPAGSADAARRFPTVHNDELTVIDDTGGVYRGGDAYLMCLYALQQYREMSLTLPPVLARSVFEKVVVK